MSYLFFFFFFNDTATTEIYTLSLHDALPISLQRQIEREGAATSPISALEIAIKIRRNKLPGVPPMDQWLESALERSEEHTSELQSPCNLVCRLLLEKKKKKK